MLKLPKFSNEREEANWWYDNQDMVASEFERAEPKLSPSSHARRMAALRGITPEQWIAEKVAESKSEAGYKPPVELPRSA